MASIEEVSEALSVAYDHLVIEVANINFKLNHLPLDEKARKILLDELAQIQKARSIINDLGRPEVIPI